MPTRPAALALGIVTVLALSGLASGTHVQFLQPGPANAAWGGLPGWIGSARVPQCNGDPVDLAENEIVYYELFARTTFQGEDVRYIANIEAEFGPATGAAPAIFNTILIRGLTPGERYTVWEPFNALGTFTADDKGGKEVTLADWRRGPIKDLGVQSGSVVVYDSTGREVLRLEPEFSGCLDSAPPLPGPVAVMTVSCAGGTCAFLAEGSATPYEAPLRYHWNFGDGVITTTTEPRVTHTYALGTGPVQAALIVSDAAGTYSEAAERTVDPRAGLVAGPLGL